MSESTLSKDEFNALMKEAGIATKKELAILLNLAYQSVNNWGNTQDYPRYVKPFLQAQIKARKYDELMKELVKYAKFD